MNKMNYSKMGMRLLAMILLLFSLNVLFLGVRMIPFKDSDGTKCSFLHPASPDDGLPRDFVQWMAAIVYPKSGQYSIEAVRYTQLISYIVAGLVVLGIVGSCGGSKCMSEAMGKFPRGAGKGVKYMARSMMRK